MRTSNPAGMPSPPFRSAWLSLGLAMLFLLPVSAEPVPLADGFYRVMRTYPDGSSLEGALAAGERMLKFNPTFLDPKDNGEEVVIVRVEPSVPLQLAEPPSKVADRTERTKFWLGVSLNPEAAKSFETFTEENLGQRVAIVVGGEVITMHGIKEVIRGGKVQISRCGDKGCEVLFRELSDNIEESPWDD